MVVCHKDRWVNGDRTIDLLYFLIYLQITNALQNFRIPQENFSLGFTTIKKKEERKRCSLGPLLDQILAGFFWAIYGSITPSFCTQNLQKSATYLLEVTAKKLNRKLENFYVKPRNFSEKTELFKDGKQKFKWLKMNVLRAEITCKQQI